MTEKNVNISDDTNFRSLDETELQEVDGGENLMNGVIIKIYQKISDFFG